MRGANRYECSELGASARVLLAIGILAKCAPT
jgi:hypothetical protein